MYNNYELFMYTSVKTLNRELFPGIINNLNSKRKIHLKRDTFKFCEC